MTEPGGESILIVEDDLDVADMLAQFFSGLGYPARAVHWGEDAISACQAELPDLLILDIRLPDIDGFEVARRLRTARRTRDVPIIFLTERRERADRLRGLELHADDYMTKPFDAQELRLRARNAIARAHRTSLADPITGLPAGSAVDEELSRFLAGGQGAVLMVAINNLASFRENSGFVTCNDMLRAISFLLDDIVHELGSPDDFLGQFQPGRFIIVTYVSSRATLKERIRKRLEQSFDFFYRSQELEKGIAAEQRIQLALMEIPGENAAHHDLAQFKAVLDRPF